MAGNGLPRLLNKVAVVTGSSSGLGRAIALAFASHGTKLVVCSDLQPEPRKGSEGESIATHEVIRQTYGEGKARFVKCDVGDSEEVKQVIRAAVEDGGRLDV